VALAMQRWGVKRARAIASATFQRAHQSETFHGRDVFAPCGAHLAIGAPPFAEVGPEVSDWVKLPGNRPVALPGASGLEARVVKIDDPFGNLWTNVTQADLAPIVQGYGETLVFDFGKTSVTAPLLKTFGEVAEGQPLAYWNSRGRLSLAINMGDAAKRFGVKRGDAVKVTRRPK
jgi:S-adenosylmethionine hydrolase